jgi:hypothetical protein
MDSVIFRGTMGYPIFRPTHIVNVIKSPPETDQFWVPFGASIPHVKPTWENPTGSTAETEVRAIQRSDLCGGRGGLMGVGRCWKWGHCFQILNLFCSCPLNIHFFGAIVASSDSKQLIGRRGMDRWGQTVTATCVTSKKLLGSQTTNWSH